MSSKGVREGREERKEKGMVQGEGDGEDEDRVRESGDCCKMS